MNKLQIRKLSWRKNEEGYSLVESVIATFLLTIALLSAASVLVAVTAQQRLSEIFTTATNLGEEKIETLRNDNYLQVAFEEEDYGEIVDHISFKRRVLVTPNAGDTLKTIEVIVTHMGGQQITLQTMIAR